MNSSRSELLLADLEKAVTRLAEALDRPKDSFIRDSAIQRFEFTYELVWKTLKAVLLEKHGIVSYSPKECLREAFRQGIIEDEPLWMKTVELRNLTTHTYRESIAEDIYSSLPAVLALYKKLPAKLR